MVWLQSGFGACAAGILVLACVGAAPPSPATGCATVVQKFRGLPNPVEVVGNVAQTSEGNVQIRYQSTNAENIPVTGQATCDFAIGDGGALQLISAEVDGSELGGAALAGINQSDFSAAN